MTKRHPRKPEKEALEQKDKTLYARHLAYMLGERACTCIYVFVLYAIVIPTESP